MSEINVKVMKSSVIESLRKNRKNYLENFKNSENSNWLKEKFGENIYEEKRYKITIPELVFSRELDQNVQNNINLYDSVKELPGYILAEKGFWESVKYFV
ncbi:hypothetical protein [Dubosiella newyorkensis]|uniref:hypothetical protein n=1 Tax=Dubosiella newyorkensis TaxID=1862672 RepID=UPI0023F0AE39|nr:hypothetical protein [Dubosiella newyorkensis]